MTSSAGPSERVVRGPVVPTAAARAVQQTLGVDDVRLSGGVLGRLQDVNRHASIPLGLEQLETAGNLDNLRLAAGSAGTDVSADTDASVTGEFRGPVFMDSDLYKQLEAVAWDVGRIPDPALAEFITASAKLLTDVQLDDGYLNSYIQTVDPRGRYENLSFTHEMYCAGHLIQAAVASARVGGDPQLLEVARRFADHLVEVFLRGEHPGIDGHPEVETALVELYRLTGERAYLDLASRFVERRGVGSIGDPPNRNRGARYLQDHLPVREADTLVGHAVRALYLEAAIVDLYLETGDESLLECSVRRWEDMVATKTYLTGGLGSRHAQEAFGDRYELPPDRAYAETCAAIASIHWSWRLLLATGEAKYADLIERTLYNAFAASTSVDGLRFFYVNPLQRRPDHYEADDPGRRREWFECACCPPNIMRLVSSLGHYVATHTSGAVYIHQFVPGTVRAPLSSGPVELTVRTDLPWSGQVTITVDQGPEGEWTLALRVPSWSTTTRARVGDEPAPVEPDEHGYLLLTRDWQRGDTVTFELDLTPRLVHPHPRIDAVRGTVALERGPLVYCFEQVDQPDGIEVADLAIAPGARLRPVEAEHGGVGRTVVIEVEATALAGDPVAGLPYRSGPRDADRPGREVVATAIPHFQWDNRDGGAMRVWMPRLPFHG
ncbi:glycoside hydrolase family 127 protein [Actinopolymorpha pittospori]|uniref:DUF1680 family protein n=1 Tax=Actinopolymorpha pittospori TaxID=648752 RepID=A0A927N1W4_9ACTN|nr:beta-L-arabinofuranosidase domain-containing protein [Actinopolymorpha pittospori]MBE1607392.1 DUF1680 family protein [Actinopolymorpha pittospori]